VTTLNEMFASGGQSPWIDDLKRSYVRAGGLADLVAKGIRGLTSNPTIMAHSIEAGTDYDEQFNELIESGKSVEDAYWDLVTDDVGRAATILRPLHDDSGGEDGFVSIEVAPSLAQDSAATIEMARSLNERLAQPNVYIKIPGTRACLPAIEQMISEGRSINVTLIFSLERYDAVIDAYLRGLERLIEGGGDASKVSSVASFFVSRVDTEVDKRLDAIIADGGEKAETAKGIRGQAALAQARLAYALFKERFSGSQFAELKAAGARVQRPLWASTSTKDPAYPDLLYVDGLIGPDTVNTMPAATVEAFLDHGTVAPTLDQDPVSSRSVLDALATVGIDLNDVTNVLEQEGVASFSKSFDELIGSLREKAAVLQKA
jgi:transaldolase